MVGSATKRQQRKQIFRGLQEQLVDRMDFFETLLVLEQALKIELPSRTDSFDLHDLELPQPLGTLGT